VFLKILDKINRGADAATRHVILMIVCDRMQERIVVLDDNQSTRWAKEVTTKLIAMIDNIYHSLGNSLSYNIAEEAGYSIFVRLFNKVIQTASNEKEVIKHIVRFCDKAELSSYVMSFVARALNELFYSMKIRNKSLPDDDMISFLRQSPTGKITLSYPEDANYDQHL